MKALRTGLWTAWLSAGCTFVGAILSVLLFTGVFSNLQFPNIEENSYFNTETLNRLWKWRSDISGISTTITFFEAAGLLLFMHPMLCLRKMHKRYEGMAPKLMAMSFSCGALLTVLEFLQNLGSTLGGVFFVWNGGKNFPEEDLPRLEIAYRLAEARSVWLFAFQYLFFSCGFMFAALLAFSARKLSKGHGILGIVIGLLGFLLFIFDIITYYVPDTRLFFGLLSLAWGVLLIPAWLLWLGLLLGKSNDHPKHPVNLPQLNEGENE